VSQTEVVAQVVLIGGSASVGKTSLAETLARRQEIHNVIHIDEIRRRLPAALQRLKAPGVWDSPPDRLLQLLLEETAAVRSALIDVTRGLVRGTQGAIVEGEGLEPDVLTAFNDEPEVRGIFIIETDPRALHMAFAARSSRSRFVALPPSQRAAVVEMSRRYGLHLREAAERHQRRWIASKPWATLTERAEAALVGP
jgi:2-phosphoglycerate kinase